MIGLRTGLKVGPRVGLAVGVVADELSAGGGGVPVLLSIDVTPDDPTMAFGDGDVQFTATGTYDSGPPQDLTATAVWASDTPSVATVDAAGLVTPVGAGTSVISATVGAISGSSTPTVTVALVSIDVTPNAPTWRPTASSDRQEFTATGTFDDASTADITASVVWTSGTPTVGTISNGAGTEGEVTPLLVGTTLITATSGAVSGNETLTIDTAIDATSLKRVPLNAFQWSLLGRTPTALWLCQEAAGAVNLADSIGSLTLTANATPLYQQAVAGWTRTASAFNQNTNQRFTMPSGTGPSPATTSTLWLAYWVNQTAPGGLRGIMAAASNVFIANSNIGNVLRVSVVGVTADDATTNPVGDDLVHPLVLLYDRTNSRAMMYTDEAATTGTYNAGATDGNKGIGGITGATGSTAALSGSLYFVMFQGAAAELDDAAVRSLLQALNWTVAW